MDARAPHKFESLVWCGDGKSGQPMIWTGGGMGRVTRDCTMHDGINVTDLKLHCIQRRWSTVSIYHSF